MMGKGKAAAISGWHLNKVQACTASVVVERTVPVVERVVEKIIETVVVEKAVATGADFQAHQRE